MVAVSVTGCPACGAAGLTLTVVRVFPRTVVQGWISTGDWHWKLVLPWQLTSTVYPFAFGGGALITMFAVAVLPPGLGERVAVKTEPVTLSIVAVTGPAGTPDELRKTTVAVTVAVLP